MTRSLVAVFLALFLALPSPSLWAQTDGRASISDGDRIRITLAREDRRLVGQLLSSDDEILTLELSRRNPPVRVLRSDITRIEVSQGQSRGRGALRGAAIGALVGLGWGAVEEAGCEGLGCGLGYIGLPILVAPVGAVIGALAPWERWKPINTNDLHVALTPTPGGGVGAQVAFSF